MHNGGLGAWKHIKRRLGERLADKWYLGVCGGTDSEWAFALYLDTLERMGHDPSNPPPEGFGPNVLRQAMLQVIKQINIFIKDVPRKTIEDEKVDTRSLLNFAVTDGHSVVCTRYVSSRTDEAASLYYSSGSTWDDKKKGNFQMDRRDKGADIVLVASEPLTFERDNWVTVPTNSTLTIHNQTVMVHPIIDEYYNQDPSYTRSSQYVAEKGLVTDKESTTPPRAGSRTPNAPAAPSEEQVSPKQLSLPTSRLSGCPVSLSARARSPERVDENFRPLSSMAAISSARDPLKPQEQGNTKKKRVSLTSTQLADEDDLVAPIHRRVSITSASGSLPPPMERQRENSYGSPSKIVQYFPELS